MLEALLSFTTTLEVYTQEVEKLTSASQLSVSESAAEGSEEEKTQYLERRRRKESEAIGELVGPLLTGELCLSHFAVGCSLSSTFQLTFRNKRDPAGCTVISSSSLGLRSGVRLIAGAYGERLEVFKFSPETAERLQAVVD